MANPIFNSCLGRQSLRTGSIIAGAGAILLSIVFLILMYVLRFTPKTILFDWLPPWIVKIVIAFNMCMTILISAIMIVGAVKVSFPHHLHFEFNRTHKVAMPISEMFTFNSQRNHYLMLPWVVLGCMLVIGFLLSVIYTTVMFIINGYLINALVFAIVGLILVRKYKKNQLDLKL